MRDRPRAQAAAAAAAEAALFKKCDTHDDTKQVFTWGVGEGGGGAEVPGCDLYTF